MRSVASRDSKIRTSMLSLWDQSGAPLFVSLRSCEAGRFQRMSLTGNSHPIVTRGCRVFHAPSYHTLQLFEIIMAKVPWWFRKAGGCGMVAHERHESLSNLPALKDLNGIKSGAAPWSHTLKLKQYMNYALDVSHQISLKFGSLFLIVFIKIIPCVSLTSAISNKFGLSRKWPGRKVGVSNRLYFGKRFETPKFVKKEKDRKWRGPACP